MLLLAIHVPLSLSVRAELDAETISKTVHHGDIVQAAAIIAMLMLDTKEDMELEVLAFGALHLHLPNAPVVIVAGFLAVQHAIQTIIGR